MAKLPYKEFPDIMADFERFEHTRQFAEALKNWLTALHRTPDDVHSFSLSAENSLDACIFYLEAQCGPAYDVTVNFKDGSIERAQFSLAGQRRITWGDLLEAVRWGTTTARYTGSN